MVSFIKSSEGLLRLDLLKIYGGRSTHLHFLLVYGAAALWGVALVAFGFAAQRGYRWAFWAGIVLYGADMIALAITFSLWSLDVHAFFVLKWFQGQKAIQDLQGGIAPKEALP